MFNYIKAEFYRIFSKKSMYIYFASLLGLYIAYIFISSNGLTEDSILGKANYVFLFLSLFGSGYLFATIYNDDLNAKSLPSFIGFGMKRSTIVISKIIINAIMTILMFAVAFVIFCLIFYIIGLKIDGDTLTSILNLIFGYLLKLFAYTSIASVIVYGTQKATMSMVTFILLITMFIDQMLIALLNDTLEKIFTIALIVENLMFDASILLVLNYLIYVIVFITLSIFAFCKKDLEF
jgi:ABC-type transport system involved in multi-copper enzyme maturation permease subunit